LTFSSSWGTLETFPSKLS